jgi:hypothetical protein
MPVPVAIIMWVAFGSSSGMSITLPLGPAKERNAAFRGEPSVKPGSESSPKLLHKAVALASSVDVPGKSAQPSRLCDQGASIVYFVPWGMDQRLCRRFCPFREHVFTRYNMFCYRIHVLIKLRLSLLLNGAPQSASCGWSTVERAGEQTGQ